MKTKRSSKNKINFWQKSWGFLKENRKTLILITSLSLLSLGMVMIKLHSLGLSWTSKKTLLVFGILLLLTIVISIILLYAKRKQWKIENVYLICGLLLGTFYCFCLPVGAIPDEPAHFKRVYEISEGNIVQKDGGSMMPSNIEEIIDAREKNDGYRLEFETLLVQPNEEKEFFGAPNYAVFNYIPQTFGVLIGKILHMPFVFMLLLARFLNMVCCVLAVYFCIKYIPVLKKILFTIALFPMTMQLFASVSADGSIICAGIALISYVLYAREGMERKFKIWDFLLLFFVCLILVVTKPVYAFICPIVFWIPKERFKSQKWKIGIITLLGTLCLAILLLRMSSASAVLNGRYGDTQMQTDMMLHNPLKLMWLIFANIIASFQFYFDGIVGSSLEWFSLNYFYPYVITIIIIIAILCCERQGKISMGLRVFSILAFSMVVITTFVSMFLTWSVPGSALIEGVQGRYFLPALLLIPLACLPSGKENKVTRKKEIISPSTLYVAMALINIYVVTIIVASHIVG